MGADKCKARSSPVMDQHPIQGGVLEGVEILDTEAGLLRWLTRIFLRLDSARYHRLPNVSINRAFKNDTSNPNQVI